MSFNERRALRKLSQDPDRWWQADMQRQAVIWWLVRRLSICVFLTVLIVFIGIYARTHGGN
jgi:hypothetical protein